MQTQVFAREDLDFVHFNATYRHSTPYRERERARAREGGREGGRERGRECVAQEESNLAHIHTHTHTYTHIHTHTHSHTHTHTPGCCARGIKPYTD